MNTFFTIFSNKTLFFNKDFDIIKVLCSSGRVFVDISVKKIIRKDKSSIVKNMKKFGNKKKTFVATLEKSEEDKGRLDRARNVKKLGSNRKKTFITVSSPIA